jgi:hypothetical protein
MLGVETSTPARTSASTLLTATLLTATARNTYNSREASKNRDAIKKQGTCAIEGTPATTETISIAGASNCGDAINSTVLTAKRQVTTRMATVAISGTYLRTSILYSLSGILTRSFIIAIYRDTTVDWFKNGGNMFFHRNLSATLEGFSMLNLRHFSTLRVSNQECFRDLSDYITLSRLFDFNLIAPVRAFRNCLSPRYFTRSGRGIGYSFQLAITAPLYSITGYCIATAQS